eukprot:3136915-Pyramimonas_sp.AAC.1
MYQLTPCCNQRWPASSFLTQSRYASGMHSGASRRETGFSRTCRGPGDLGDLAAAVGRVALGGILGDTRGTWGSGGR